MFFFLQQKWTIYFLPPHFCTCTSAHPHWMACVTPLTHGTHRTDAIYLEAPKAEFNKTKHLILPPPNVYPFHTWHAHKSTRLFLFLRWNSQIIEAVFSRFPQRSVPVVVMEICLHLALLLKMSREPNTDGFKLTLYSKWSSPMSWSLPYPSTPFTPW